MEAVPTATQAEEDQALPTEEPIAATDTPGAEMGGATLTVFRIAPGERPPEVTVAGSTEGLLMEGFRRLDEERRAAEAPDEGESGRV